MKIQLGTEFYHNGPKLFPKNIECSFALVLIQKKKTKQIEIELCYGIEIHCFKLLEAPSILTWMLVGGTFIILLYTDALQNISALYKPLLPEICFSTH